MIDTVTLYNVLVAVTIVGAGLVWHFARQRPEALGARAWAAGVAGVGLYFALVLFRDHIPILLSFTIGNSLAVVAIALMHRGACEFSGRPHPWRWHAGAAVGVAATIAIFWQDPETGYHARVVLVSLVTGAQSVAVAWTLRDRESIAGTEEMYARRLSVAVFTTLTILQAVRFIAHITPWTGRGVSILDDTTLARWTAATFLVLSLALPFLIVYLNEARSRLHLRTTRDQLAEALAHVRTLRGLVPICSSCNKIRDTNDAWQSIERYLSDHTDVQLSHGVCPDCMRKLYPEYAEEILNQPRK